MALHIDKDRTNNIDSRQHDNDSLQDTTFEIVNEVYKCTLGSQLINVKPIVMKVDYSSSM